MQFVQSNYKLVHKFVRLVGFQYIAWKKILKVNIEMKKVNFELQKSCGVCILI